MKKILTVIFLGIIFSGCAKDDLTKYLKDHEYKAITPISDGHYVGGIYPKNDLSGAPLILLSDALDKAKADQFMVAHKRQSSLKDVQFNKTYDIGADVKIIGNISGTLKQSGVKKFRVKVTGAEEYVLSQAKFKELVVKEYRKGLLGNSSIDGKYYVYSLLKVASLEYVFFNDKDTKISVETLENIEDKIKGKIGTSWEITRSGNLKTIGPRFIGFRAAKIKTDSSGTPILKRAPINDEGPGGEPRPHAPGPNCYRDCP